MAVSYAKLWKLLIDKRMKKQDLRIAAGISTSTMSKLGRDENVTTVILAKICSALECDIGDIIEISNEKNDIIDDASKPSLKSSKKDNELKVISLFTGAGGLDVGFEKAGFSISVAVEADSACCDTLRANKPDLPIINKKIEDVSSSDILSIGGINPLEAALVIGGPPCQSFSLAGLRKGLEDDRGKLLFEFVRVVRDALPKGFVFENVKGLANWDNGRALELLIKELSRPIEYKGQVYCYTVTKPQVMNAADFGVPQHRERIIIVGNRESKDFNYPKAKYDIGSYMTVWDAIGHLPESEKPSAAALRVASSIKGRRERHGY